jgi:hypothetical protein
VRYRDPGWGGTGGRCPVTTWRAWISGWLLFLEALGWVRIDEAYTLVVLAVFLRILSYDECCFCCFCSFYLLLLFCSKIVVDRSSGTQAWAATTTLLTECRTCPLRQIVHWVTIIGLSIPQRTTPG